MLSQTWRHFITTSLNKGLLCNGAVSSLGYHIRGKKRKVPKPLDPHHADELPEVEYVGTRSQPDKLVYTWGVANHGALGRPSFIRPDKEKRQHRLQFVQHPHRLAFGEYHKVTDLTCGYGFTVFAVNKTPEASCFGTGLNTDSQVGGHQPRRDHPLGMLISPAPIEVPVSKTTNVIKVAAGRAHTVMVTDKEGVWTVGNNAYGQCGRSIIADEDYGKQTIYNRIRILDQLDIAQVECGQDTSFFLTKDGVVYSCGWGADGQTGRGHYDNEPHVGPVIGDIEGEKVVKVSCRADCVLAINDKGEVFGWGNSEYQQLNSVTDEMQIHTSRKLKLPGVGKVVDVAASGTMCLLLNEDGQVFSWGFGPIGKGPEVTYSKTPTHIPSTLFGKNELTPDAKVVSVTCGINILAAINSHGCLFTWGKNPGGCLGLGHIKDQYFPVRVAIAGEVLKVSCGVDHMAALVREII